MIKKLLSVWLIKYIINIFVTKGRQYFSNNLFTNFKYKEIFICIWFSFIQRWVKTT